MKKLRKKLFIKTAKLIGILLFWFFTIEFFSYFIYNYFLPDPFIKKGTVYIKNRWYGFAGNYLRPDFNETTKLKKDNKTIRIFSFGASTTAGWPYGQKFSYTAYLKKYLQKIYLNKNIEVINLAILGFDSLEVLHTVEKSIKYSPDIIIIYTSHNIVEDYNLRKLKLNFFNKGFLKIKSLSFYKLLNYYMNIITSKGLRNWKIRPDNTRYHIFNKSIITQKEKESLIQNYSYNINALIHIASKYKIKLIFLKPIYNMSDRGPVYSFYSKSLSQKKKDFFLSTLNKGIRFYKNQCFPEAIKAFKNCSQIDKHVAILNFYLANCFYQINNIKNALYYRKKSIERDGLWSICPGSFYKILKNIKETSFITVIDLYSKIKNKTGIQYFNSEWFIDNIHPKPITHRIIASIIAETIINKNWISNSISKKIVIPALKINLRKEMGDDKYYQTYKNIALYKYHISFWTFDPFPILNNARQYMDKYITYKNGNLSLDEDIYYFSIKKELGESQDIDLLLKKWKPRDIQSFLNSTRNKYNHFKYIEEGLNLLLN